MAGLKSRPLAVVTAASSGLGYELALRFACGGFDLIITADDDKMAATARTLEEFGGQVTPVQADLATFEGVENLYLAIQCAASPVAALAVTANAPPGGDFVRNNSLEGELRLVDRAVVGAVHLSKRVLADMVAHNTGRILFTSSIAAGKTRPGRATRAASNAFLAAFAEALQDELRDTGVTIVTKIPALTGTRLAGQAGMAELARRGFEALMADASASYHALAGSAIRVRTG